jgi:hypothetical protein
VIKLEAFKRGRVADYLNLSDYFAEKEGDSHTLFGWFLPCVDLSVSQKGAPETQ